MVGEMTRLQGLLQSEEGELALSDGQASEWKTWAERRLSEAHALMDSHESEGPTAARELLHSSANSLVLLWGYLDRGNWKGAARALFQLQERILAYQKTQC